MDELDKAWQTMLAIMLALLGGIARLLAKKDDVRLRWGVILSELLLSAFAGTLTFLIALEGGLSGNWIGVACGIAGYGGAKTIDFIERVMKEKVGAKKTQEE